MATVGKNILDNLTTGMYSDSKVIYREYIQNACDSINHAIEEGIMDAGSFLIDIYIDGQKRYISIKDNGTGRPLLSRTWAISQTAIKSAAKIKVFVESDVCADLHIVGL